MRALQEFHVECSSHTSRCSVELFSAHGGGRGHEVCSPASWRCAPRRESASAKARRRAALSTLGGLGRYWAAQWHLARAVDKRFRGCRAKRLYLHYKLTRFFNYWRAVPYAQPRKYTQPAQLLAARAKLKAHSQPALRTGSMAEVERNEIQTHMAQKPVLRVEVGARALSVRSVSREEA